MRIAELFKPGRPVFSFEFFPPKTEAGVRTLFRTMDELRSLEPDFVSVTYPLERSRRYLTVEIVSRVRRELGIEAMAHLTRVDASREEIRQVLERLEAEGIENVLALGGDPPVETPVIEPEAWFPYASDLVSFIREHFGFCVSGAAHPEKHPQAPDLETDLQNLRYKVQAGCEFLITQFFYSNADYFSLLERARALGIEVPIVPGIMPITSVPGIQRMAKLNGSKLPEDLFSALKRVEDDAQAVETLGVAYAHRQCRELLERGAPGIHFYTLNRSPATRKVLTCLREGGDV